MSHGSAFSKPKTEILRLIVGFHIWMAKTFVLLSKLMSRSVICPQAFSRRSRGCKLFTLSRAWNRPQSLCLFPRTEPAEGSLGGQSLITINCRREQFFSYTVEAPSTRIRFHLKAQLFFADSASVHTYPMKTKTENGTFQNALQSGTFWKRCFREYVWTEENGTFRKRWRHTISSKPLRAIL